ncbi:MAG: hypothetical protein Q4D95_04735 [Peptoniphilus sp.]|nr:hypothetical protein [Peptoniphilus sp.]
MHEEHEQSNLQRKKRWNRNKIRLLLLSFILIMTMTVGGVMAYIFTKTASKANKFTPSEVTCAVTENFDGTYKKNVNVKNTGDTEAYIRVKLVTYRVNAEGEHIGGLATIPDFDPGENWIKHEGYYYYTLPVTPKEKPATDLIGGGTFTGGGIALKGTYADADGGRQVIEVMAEAIQSGPAKSVGESWGVSISPGSVTDYTQGGGGI